MESLDDSELRSDGGRHSIKLGVTFEDPNTPEYTNAIVWNFEPTLATDAQTPVLEIRGVLHKKYWNEIEPDLTTPTTDDGSDVVYSGGWLDGPFEPETVPDTVRAELASIFGSELATNTIENASEIFECELEEPNVPNIPTTHTIVQPEFTVKIDGSYVKYLDEDDERVSEQAFTSHMKNAETGEILDTSHPINHNASWWFEPTETGHGVQIRECFHKTWDDKMYGGFEEKYDRETVIESYRDTDASPPIETLPTAVLTTLAEWFGEPFVQTMLEGTNREMPTYVYECFDCETATQTTPRNTCPNCGSDSTCRYDSLEQYEEIIEDEDETTKQVKQMLASAEPTVTTDSPN